MNKKQLEEKIFGLLEKLIVDNGFYLVDVEYGTENKNKTIKVFVDRDNNGITIDDCTNLSYLVGPVLEAEGIDNIISGAYTLEISSPGMFRKLKREQDFVRAVGKRVKLKLKERIDKKNVIIGLLDDYKTGVFLINEGDKKYKIEKNKIKSINLEPELDF